MKKSKYIFIFLIFLLIISCSDKEKIINTNDANSNFEKESISIVKNKIAPNFSLTSIDGSVINYESSNDTILIKFFFSDFLITLLIASILYSTSKTLRAFSLPSCLLPKFIVNVFSEGASRMPLEEFPITQSTCFSNDR